MPGLAFRLLLPFAAVAGGLIPSAVTAQGRVETVLELGGRSLSLSPTEREALSRLARTINGRRPGLQDAALAAARRFTQGPDAIHLLAVYQLEIANQRNDNDLRAPALDVLIASDLTRADRIPAYLATRGQIAYERGDLDTARTLWARRLELEPNDPQAIANLAQVDNSQGNLGGAADMLERAIAARQAAGGPVPETLYRQWMSVAHDARLVGPGINAARTLVTAYPNARNWREALVVYRQLAAPAEDLEIDLFRLMRAVGALAKGPEYQRMAQLLMHGGMAAEAKAVLDEGLARRVIEPGESPTREIIAEVDRFIPRQRREFEALQATRSPSVEQARSMADTLLGLGHYAEAAALYRTTLERAAGPAAEMSTRLGMALLLAGRRPEAEAAFRQAAAASGPEQARYGALARFWLAWLAQPSGRGS